jgi:hypothetical protein
MFEFDLFQDKEGFYSYWEDMSLEEKTWFIIRHPIMVIKEIKKKVKEKLLISPSK